MKLPIILFCTFALAAGGYKKMTKSNFMGNFVDMVKGYGYSTESYDVQTEDGYILTMFRIPNGQEIRETSSESDSREDSHLRSRSVSPEPQPKKGVVFFMHGLLTNCESFIYGGPSQSLALHLADEGYDVFLGNARGTIYGQRHTTLNPKKDAAFWRYTWHEIGTRDLPAMINKALSVSGRNQLSYLGHNEGTTSFYVMATEEAEMRNKIDRHVSLGPIVFMKNSTNEVLQNIETHVKQRSWLIKNLGINTFAPSAELLREAELTCMEKMKAENICKNVYFLMNGYNSKQLNQTTLNQFMSRLPSVASVREILHFVQLKSTGRFEMYSEDFNGRDYDLSKVDVPVALLCTPNDQLSTPMDVETLSRELPNVYMKTNLESLDNNLDLLYSERMDLVKEKVKQALEQVVPRLS